MDGAGPIRRLRRAAPRGLTSRGALSRLACLWAGALLCGLVGCTALPDYHLPQGFSSSYHRALRQSAGMTARDPRVAGTTAPAIPASGPFSTNDLQHGPAIGNGAPLIEPGNNQLPPANGPGGTRSGPAAPDSALPPAVPPSVSPEPDPRTLLPRIAPPPPPAPGLPLPGPSASRRSVRDNSGVASIPSARLAVPTSRTILRASRVVTPTSTSPAAAALPRGIQAAPVATPSATPTQPAAAWELPPSPAP